ncbi:MAG: prepilin-type N-terminal cleavage/methylation domain-containing protein [Gemmatimonadota bacterium]
MNPSPRLPETDVRSSGMTLPELIVALTVFAVVITAAVAFMARQNTAFQTGISRITVLRNLRYATTTLSQDLETLGTNVPGSQPALLYADEDVIAFSADYATNVANDPFAVFYDPDAPQGQVVAPAASFSLPNAPVTLPDTVYESVPGVRSPAEILIFFFGPDTSTTRTDDFLLYRQVNDAEPEVIARRLLQTGSNPFFSYLRLGPDASGELAVVPVPDSLIPLRHLAPIHGSAPDTGSSAIADSVRAVQVQISATNGLSGPDEVVVQLSRLIALPNAGFGMLATCGAAPILGVGLNAAATTLGTGEKAVRLTWTPAVDENGGEGDVVRYVIWRRSAGAPDWGDPYLAIPAGAASYTYEDAAVEAGTAYQYALAAQDCTPTLSSLAVSGTVLVP